MVYKKYSRKPYYKKKRRGYNRRRYRGNYIFYRRLKNKMWRMARYLNVEFKQHNIANVTNAVGSGLTSSPLTIIDQGDTDETRDGASIKLATLQVKGYVTINASATNSLVRLMVIWDKQTNETAFSAGDLLNANNINSYYNIDNGSRFKVIFDKLVTLSQDNPIKTFNFYKKIGLHIRYDNSSGSIADQTQNSLWFSRVSNEATNTPNVTWTARLRYVDN